jgi:hypothetical protein
MSALQAHAVCDCNSASPTHHPPTSVSVCLAAGLAKELAVDRVADSIGSTIGKGTVTSSTQFQLYHPPPSRLSPELNPCAMCFAAADLVNEPSRWGCQWERDCADVSGTVTCAPGAELYHRATMAIHNWDPNTTIFANAMGQSHVDPHRFPQCSNPFRGERCGSGEKGRRGGGRARTREEE